MRIGLLSDSHQNTAALNKALTVFSKREVQAIVHCGDIGDITGLRTLSDLKLPVWLVSGNMDQHIVRNLSTVSQGTNVIFEQNIVEVQLENGKKLAATHGDNSYVMDNLVYSREFDYVCHGHTHRISDSRIDNTRIICPGAVSGPRYPDFPTVAVLDSKSDSLEFYNIDNPAKAFRI